MKIKIAIASVFVFYCCSAQTIKSNLLVKGKKISERQQGWFVRGENLMLFDQNAFSDWIAGGVNSTSLNSKVDYEFNYTKEKTIWDNRIILGYGIKKNNGQSSRKSNDVIDLTSTYGYNIINNWFYAASVNLKSQFVEGYDYSPTPKKKLTNFMSPGYLTIGTGLDYKPSNNFEVSIHLASARITFVTDRDLQIKDKFGLKRDGDVSVLGLGAFFGTRYKLKLMKNITFDSNLGIYSNYRYKPFNVDISYMGKVDMVVNKLVSAQISINLLYDEDQIKRIQMKQALGIGIKYKFDNKKDPPKKETDSIAS